MRLCQDKDYLKEMAIAAYRNATRPEYQWRNIAERWNAIFEDVLSEK
jgi:hypothetical protein